MDLLSSITQSLNQALSPGQRVIRVNGFEEAEKYPMPINCEAIMIDSNPNSDYIYMKATDLNGGEKFARYKIVEDPIPRFDPDKYVTTNDFEKLKEDISNGFDSIKQLITASTERANRSNGGIKQPGRTNNEFRGPEQDIQSGGK